MNKQEDWRYLRDEHQPNAKLNGWFGMVIASGFSIGIGIMIGMAACSIGL